MQLTIGPMVSEIRAPFVRVLHVLGGLLGGATMGVIAAVIGVSIQALLSIPPQSVFPAIGAVSLLACVMEIMRRGSSVGPKRQTFLSWRYVLPPGWAAFLNGADLGLGISTRVYFLSVIVVVFVAMGLGNLITGAALGAVFGGVRAASVVLFLRSPRHTMEVVEGLEVRRGLVRSANALALLCLAAGSFAL